MMNLAVQRVPFGFPKSPGKLADQHSHMLLQEFEGGMICVLCEGREEHLWHCFILNILCDEYECRFVVYLNNFNMYLWIMYFF